MSRATASRTVMKLSGKWRSGREGVLRGGHSPSGRRGEKPITLGDYEAGKHDRDVMVPARIAAPFVMVEAEFTLEILIGPFNAPALHDQADKLLVAAGILAIETKK